MRFLFAALIVSAVVAFALGVQRLQERVIRGAACELRTFDHVSFLRLVRSEQDRTTEILQRLNDSASDPLRTEKAAYFTSKLQSLRDLAPLVEGQISRFGSTYACVDSGYALLMYELDYPTFAGLARHDEIEWLWQRLERTKESSFLRILEITLGPGVALAIGLLGIWSTARRPKE